MPHGITIAKPLTLLSTALLAGLITAGCQGSSQPETEASPSPAEAVASPTSTSLEPGTYCFKLAAPTKEASSELAIAPNQQVSGKLNGTIKNQAEGYFTSYQREFKGKLDGDQLQVAVSTKIENDVQNEVEDWTLSATQLVAKQDILSRVDCAELAQAPPAPAPTPAAPATPKSERRRVEFMAGSNASTVADSLVRGSQHTYVLNARADQRMRVIISSLEDNVAFDIISPSGQLLNQEVKGADLYLPESGDYEIVVGGTRGNVEYQLKMQID